MQRYGGAASTLEALYDLGTWVCEKIDEFAPDVVVGLAHSGWLPVLVARSIQNAVGIRPFPPAVRTNIGLEKHGIYIRRYGKPFPVYCCSECSDEPFRTGHYLAWLAQRHRWLKELDGQMREALGDNPPQRILVVDDIFGGLRSGYTAMGLLGALYPQSRAVMLAGYADLTNAFVDEWIATFAPRIAERIHKTNEGERIRYGHKWHERLKPLINGSEDRNPASLTWRAVDADSDAVQAAAAFIPIEIVLESHDWAVRTACRYAYDRLNGILPEEDVVKHEDQRGIPIRELEIRAEEWKERDAWLERGVELSPDRPQFRRWDDSYEP